MEMPVTVSRKKNWEGGAVQEVWDLNDQKSGFLFQHVQLLVANVYVQKRVSEIIIKQKCLQYLHAK